MRFILNCVAQKLIKIELNITQSWNRINGNGMDCDILQDVVWGLMGNGSGQWIWMLERRLEMRKKKEMIIIPRCGYFICNFMNSNIRMWREIPFKNNCKFPPFLFIAVAIIVWREHHLLSTKVKGWDPLIWELNLTLILSQPFWHSS